MKAALDLLDLIQGPNMMGRQGSRRSLRKLHVLYHCLIFSVVFHRFRLKSIEVAVECFVLLSDFADLLCQGAFLA